MDGNIPSVQPETNAVQKMVQAAAVSTASASAGAALISQNKKPTWLCRRRDAPRLLRRSTCSGGNVDAVGWRNVNLYCPWAAPGWRPGAAARRPRGSDVDVSATAVENFTAVSQILDLRILLLTRVGMPTFDTWILHGSYTWIL